jgi:hypothetical protein
MGNDETDARGLTAARLMEEETLQLVETGASREPPCSVLSPLLSTVGENRKRVSGWLSSSSLRPPGCVPPAEVEKLMNCWAQLIQE